MPVPSCQDSLPPGVRARLWLRGDWLGLRNERWYLWLHLDDGRVLAFYLPEGAGVDDRAIAELVAAVATDHRGTLLEVRLGEEGTAIPLYAAPAVALPALPWGDPRHDAARRFAEGLDQEILSLLAGLNRHRHWHSLRNYNRLAALDPLFRERRLQALSRFPLLVAPILLSAHRDLDFAGGKRHAWRDHDGAILDTIDQGRNLAGALARHYGISKGLVRGPICATMWGETALAHRRLLQLLEGIPAHRRPHHPDDFAPAMPIFITLNLLADDHTDLGRLGRTAFRAGLAAVCSPLQAQFAPLGPAFADCSDFIRAAADRAAQIGPYPRGLTEHRLELAWIEARGLRSLLAASRRWHGRAWEPPVPDQDPDPAPGDQAQLAAILGEYWEGGAQGQELTTAAALAREGETLHHCVAQYWAQCRDRGTRIFALALGTERGTAEYRFALADARFTLAQVRGPYNAEASPALMVCARSILAALNDLGRAPVRGDLALSLRARRPEGRIARRPARPLDAASERELAAVMVYLRPPLASGELVRDYVAGYQFHGGIELEPQMAVGDELELARELENPHDGLAVAIRWRGLRIGYVPRVINAVIARRLDVGDHLACQLIRLDDQADPWERVAFTIRQVRACPSWAA
ncbi:MAG: PcfJ domain-containing protein [Chromatiaceae bacterium]|nr:PcfJ domain-containing protein [Chromatiaceae bacterium]MBP8283909.1 PcfJ domain-containing protein [Chromatiaceae bacterium]MBP8289175.1 PcfJ domain-containing protein [Chromatiaceae bacterium]